MSLKPGIPKDLGEADTWGGDQRFYGMTKWSIPLWAEREKLRGSGKYG